MFKNTKTFSSFSVDDSQKAQEFYGETLGMDIDLVEGMEDFGMLELHIADSSSNIMIYPKPNHEPATFTVLNFPVKDIDDAVDELRNRGVKFERYEDEAFNMDEKNISRSRGPEPNIAWFKDPAGNILSVLQDN